MNMLRTLGIAGLATGMLLALAVPGFAEDIPRTGHWSAGAEAGAQARTIGGTAFIMRGYAAYHVAPRISTGAMAFASSASGLTEYAAAGIARFHIPAGSMSVVPFAGVGLMSADYQDDWGNGLYVPMGVTVEKAMSGSIFTGTLLVNVHHLTFDVGAGRDRGSVGLMIGVGM